MSCATRLPRSPTASSPCGTSRVGSPSSITTTMSCPHPRRLSSATLRSPSRWRAGRTDSRRSACARSPTRSSGSGRRTLGWSSSPLSSRSGRRKTSRGSYSSRASHASCRSPRCPRCASGSRSARMLSASSTARARTSVRSRSSCRRPQHGPSRPRSSRRRRLRMRRRPLRACPRAQRRGRRLRRRVPRARPHAPRSTRRRTLSASPPRSISPRRPSRRWALSNSSLIM